MKFDPYNVIVWGVAFVVCVAFWTAIAIWVIG